MVNAGQDEFETYRVIVLDRSGAEILLVPDRDRYTLPSVSIPRWQRVAENLTVRFKLEWDHEVVCLFTLDNRAVVEDNQIQYQIAEQWRSLAGSRSTAQWLEETSLTEDLFVDRSDYTAVRDSMARCHVEMLDAQSGPFARPGWFRELYQWIQGVTQPLGSPLNGAFQQLNASPSFSLIRFETEGPAFWFKAVGPPNQAEFPITRTLAELFPECIPPIFADRPDWNGWLTREAAGVNLAESQKSALWDAAAAALARLQLASIGHSRRILAAGAHDLRVASLADRVQPFMETMALVMERQTKVPPPALSRAELAVVGERICQAIDKITDLEIPDALGHLDLNPGNIVVFGEHSVFLDWAEAYVGLPFFCLQYLLEHLRREAGTNSAIEGSLFESYRAPWDPIISSEAIADVLEVAPILAVFAYAARTDVWLDTEKLQDPATAAYLRSLTRRMKREAKQLEGRRSVCAR